MEYGGKERNAIDGQTGVSVDIAATGQDEESDNWTVKICVGNWRGNRSCSCAARSTVEATVGTAILR